MAILPIVTMPAIKWCAHYMLYCERKVFYEEGFSFTLNNSSNLQPEKSSTQMSSEGHELKNRQNKIVWGEIHQAQLSTSAITERKYSASRDVCRL
jgi:hypothetical protein